MNCLISGNAIVLLLVLILAVSCKDAETKVIAESNVTEDSKLRREVSGMLGNAIAEVTKSKEVLIAPSKENTSTQANSSAVDGTELPSELLELTTFEWSGSVENAAREIAERIGYSFSTSGNAPSISPTVHVFLESVPVAKVLEQIGLQSYPTGQIVVDPNHERIEFHYMHARSN